MLSLFFFSRSWKFWYIVAIDSQITQISQNLENFMFRDHELGCQSCHWLLVGSKFVNFKTWKFDGKKCKWLGKHSFLQVSSQWSLEYIWQRTVFLMVRFHTFWVQTDMTFAYVLRLYCLHLQYFGVPFTRAWFMVSSFIIFPAIPKVFGDWVYGFSPNFQH